jgi:hypothetical protein
MDCPTCLRHQNGELVQKFRHAEHELVATAQRLLRTAGDPLSAVIRFLHERPENQSLPGYVVNKVLLEAFEDQEKIPALVRILAAHVSEIGRHNNVIDIVNGHPATERWGHLLIKQTGRIKFEVAFERGKLVLNNISGLIGVEHGVELPLERIMVQPPKLIVTAKLGLLRPQRILDI